jgi:hypothetical protein
VSINLDIHNLMYLVIKSAVLSAGVIAARTLHEQGHDNFVIIEARHELGGRLMCHPFGAAGKQRIVESGANWIQGRHFEDFHNIDMKFEGNRYPSGTGTQESNTRPGGKAQSQDSTCAYLMLIINVCISKPIFH